jgi:hypothetical protein
MHIQAGLLLQACQEFEIFSPAARSTDILLNSEATLSFTGMLLWLIIMLYSWESLNIRIEPTFTMLYVVLWGGATDFTFACIV